jgi:hypothetical protein
MMTVSGTGALHPGPQLTLAKHRFATSASAAVNIWEPFRDAGLESEIPLAAA